LEKGDEEGEIPVTQRGARISREKRSGSKESNCLRVQFKKKSGGILHQRLNKYKKPIAQKYREGKMKRTLKREYKEFEIVEMEPI